MRRFTFTVLVLLLAVFGQWVGASASSHTITRITPATVVAGTEAFLLVVDGTGFVPGSVIRLTRTDVAAIDTDLTTIYVSGSKLYGVVLVEHIAEVGEAAIRVRLPDSSETDPEILTIAPLVVTLAPESQTIPLGSTGLLTVTIYMAQVEDRDIALASSDLTVATVPASVTIPAGQNSASVVVSTGNDGGTAILTATVDAQRGGLTDTAEVIVENPVPIIDSLDPDTAVAGRPDLSLTVFGSGFVASSTVEWVTGGLTTTLATTFMGNGELTATVPAALLAEPGLATVIVANPEPGGGVSEGATFTITAPVIILTPDPLNLLINSTASMTAIIDAAQAGDREVALASLDPGLAAVPASVTILAGETSASFTVTSFANTGSTTVTATLPAALGGNNATATVIVNNPGPVLDTLNPDTAVAGRPSLSLTANGSGFVANSTVEWNGSPLATTFFSNNQLTAVIPAALLATPGLASVTVVNPEPGGGMSNSLPFTITAPTITLLPDPLDMVTNSTDTMTVTISAVQAANRAVTLASSDPAVAAAPASVTILAGSTSASFSVNSGASAGTAILTATLPAGLGGNSAEATVNVISDVPTVTTLNPSSAVAGRPDLTLTVNGSGFVTDATVEWDGSTLATSFVNSSQLTAVVPAAALATPGLATITVVNPEPGGGDSNDVPFTITAPTITLTPDPLNMVINSTASMVVTINAVQAADRSVTLDSLDLAIASVPASVTILAGSTSASFNVSSGSIAGATTITATLPAALGGNSATATVNVNNPVPAITTIAPDSATAGDPGFALTVNGSDFVDGAVVRWNGADRLTTFVNDTQLTASIPAGDIAVAGTASVTVFNPGPGGGLSNAVTFTINNLVPEIIAIIPNSATAGGAGFTLLVTGAGFVDDSVVLWNGVARLTTFVSPVELSAVILASDIATGGMVNVTVFNPAPGGGTSNPVTFTVFNPEPVVTSLDPPSAIAGRPDLTLTVSGSDFVSTSEVEWEGAPLATTVVSSNQLTALIPAALLQTPGTAAVRVTNPAPGGGSSNEATFTINELGLTLTPDPTTLPINSSATMTVTIDQAQAADRIVDLEVADPLLLAAPATVTVPAGSLVASFTVDSGGATGQTVVTATLPLAQGGQAAPVLVNIIEEAISDLSADNSSPTTVGQTTYFTATIGAGSDVAYEWDFGDGNGGSGALADHIYSAAGIYTAVVTATNNINSLTTSTVVTITNLAPIANAGPDQTTPANDLVTLDGSASSDPDGHLPLSYGWTQIAGPAMTLDDATAAQPTFTTPALATALTFSLVVTDSYGLASQPDQVTITVGEAAALAASLTVYPAVARPGDTVTYNLTITNSGNVSLQNLASVTSVPGSFGLPASLEPEASASAQYIYVIQATDLPGPLSNQVTVTGETVSEQPVSAFVTAEVVLEQVRVFLPLVSNQPAVQAAPDLVVQTLTVANDGVTVVISNIGDEAVIDPFWVDVYFDPDPAPTAANQIWSMLSTEGLVWGIDASALPLLPGETITLVIGDAYFSPENSNFSGTIAAGTAVYAQADSAYNNQAHGAVLEIHEITGGPYNNVLGPVVADSALDSSARSLSEQMPTGMSRPQSRPSALSPRPATLPPRPSLSN
jgi:uncharacterized repeat protein (TIGR01451 family)